MKRLITITPIIVLALVLYIVISGDERFIAICLILCAVHMALQGFEAVHNDKKIIIALISFISSVSCIYLAFSLF
ncbi:hypothetical protein [Halobacillus campisalis]|uniref:DUF3953 domain-containing protein n=1 Tax=Halobacillus campisalis TaxID=435909 RepID=A0ABW2K4B3_9BACI|nr:hypothetical protein [Halobacillus campisalis]